MLFSSLWKSAFLLKETGYGFWYIDLAFWTFQFNINFSSWMFPKLSIKNPLVLFKHQLKVLLLLWGEMIELVYYLFRQDCLIFLILDQDILCIQFKAESILLFLLEKVAFQLWYSTRSIERKFPGISQQEVLSQPMNCLILKVIGCSHFLENISANDEIISTG